MDQKLRILHITNTFGIGGCERNIESISRHMHDGFTHSVVVLFNSNRQGHEHKLKGCGVKIFNLGGDISALGQIITSESIDAVLLHRAGKGERNWSRVLDECKKAGVKGIFEYNVFGLPDLSSEDEYIDVHLHKSKTSFLQFLERAARAGYRRTDRHRVLYNATDIRRFQPYLLTLPERASIKRELRLEIDSFVLLRVGRPDVRKWSDFLLYVIPLIISRIPKARVILMSAPASRVRWIKKRPWGEHCVFLENTNDDKFLAEIYQISDLLIHSSRRGETYPNTVLEAFSLKVPAVVNATPWRDNSQIEMVDHMVNGIVANSPEDYADAVYFLYRNEAVRKEMGDNALEKVKNYDARKVIRSLGRIIIDTLHEKGYVVDKCPRLAADWDISPSDDELKNYPQEYRQRLAASWGTKRLDTGGTAIESSIWFMRDIFEVARYKIFGGTKWI